MNSYHDGAHGAHQAIQIMALETLHRSLQTRQAEDDDTQRPGGWPWKRIAFFFVGAASVALAILYRFWL